MCDDSDEAPNFKRSAKPYQQRAVLNYVCQCCIGSRQHPQRIKSAILGRADLYAISVYVPHRDSRTPTGEYIVVADRK